MVAAIDDALWGFPIGGVLIGAHSESSGNFALREVPVEIFQPPLFERKTFLHVVANAALELVEELDIPKDEKIRVCRGYVNSRIAPTLESIGYTVRIGNIGEPLQGWLEDRAREYVRGLGYDGYYDPKELSQHEIRREFWKVVRWTEKNDRRYQAKTGWGFWKRRGSGEEK